RSTAFPTWAASSSARPHLRGVRAAAARGAARGGARGDGIRAGRRGAPADVLRYGAGGARAGGGRAAAPRGRLDARGGGTNLRATIETVVVLCRVFPPR